MSEDLVTALAELLRPAEAAKNEGGPTESDDDAGLVSNLRRLTGGANMQTWSFDYRCRGQLRPHILRRRPPGVAAHPALPIALSLDTESRLLSLARRAGVPVPTVIARSGADSQLGEALVMTRIDGDALPARILREARFAAARRKLAFQCGEALARLHSVSLEECPATLRDLEWQADLDRLQGLMDAFGNPSPCHQLALNWLKDQPVPASPRVLCHGDFRLGNLLVAKSGLTAVLDWELAHVGHAGEDLGYLCANVWRFSSEKPVGGFGDTADLLAGYRSVLEEAPSLQELLLWQLYAALGWGLVCLTMLELHLSGADPGLERAAVGRRLSESDIDILLLLEALGA